MEVIKDAFCYIENFSKETIDNTKNPLVKEILIKNRYSRLSLNDFSWSGMGLVSVFKQFGNQTFNETKRWTVPVTKLNLNMVYYNNRRLVVEDTKSGVVITTTSSEKNAATSDYLYRMKNDLFNILKYTDNINIIINGRTDVSETNKNVFLEMNGHIENYRISQSAQDPYINVLISFTGMVKKK